MPTLREDIIEARTRADVARHRLATKLQKRQEWDRDDKIQSIDGLDSLVSMADEVLPYIGNDAAQGAYQGKSAGKGDSSSVIIPKTGQQRYFTQFHLGNATIKPGQTVNLGRIAHPAFPDLPENYEKDRPNVLLDGDRRVWNFTNVDFTGDNAGSTAREVTAIIGLMIPADNWGDLIVYAHNDGGDNHVVARGQDPGFTQKIECRGAAVNAVVEIPLKLDGPPRGGIKDWFQISVDMKSYEGSKSIEIKEGNWQWMKFVLPHTRYSHFRDVSIYLDTIDGYREMPLTSICKAEEFNGYVNFTGEDGYVVESVNTDWMYGFAFHKAPGYQASLTKYDISAFFVSHNKKDGQIDFEADELQLSDTRFNIVRDGNVEGWLNARRFLNIESNQK